MKKFLNNLIFNITFFTILFIGIQNSNEKSKVKFLDKTTINLPISFIVGSSFIFGSVLASLVPLNLRNFSKKNHKESNTSS